MRKRLIQRKGLKKIKPKQRHKIQIEKTDRYDHMETDYLVPVVSQVDPEDSHAVEDKLHGGQEVIQHCRLPNTKDHRLRS